VFSTLRPHRIARQAERDGTLRERIAICRAALLVVDGIGYLPVAPGGSNLFFQLVKRPVREERHDHDLGPAALPNGARCSAIPSSHRPARPAPPPRHRHLDRSPRRLRRSNQPDAVAPAAPR